MAPILRHIQVLKAKALEMRDALLESLVSKYRQQNHDIIESYETILTRLAEKPTNEAHLAALRGFISNSKEKVLQYSSVLCLNELTVIFDDI